MSEHVTQTIGMVMEQIKEAESQLVEKKRMVNSLCALIDQAPIYSDTDLVVSGGLGLVSPDEYYGQPLSTAIRMILDRRKLAKRGPATVNEIYDALIEGGYKFTTNVEEHAKRGLYSTLTKNTVVFHKIPNGAYGLTEWYPNAPRPARATNGAKVADADSGDEAINSDEKSAEEPVAAGSGGTELPNKPR